MQVNLALIVLLAGCSSPDVKPVSVSSDHSTPLHTMASNKHPLGKYIELVGFRMVETAPGKLEVKFGVVNHSDADVGEIELLVSLRPTTAKTTDEPVAKFTAKVPPLGPQEMKEVKASVPTKLRVYEIPDWQFIRGDFEITAPAP